MGKFVHNSPLATGQCGFIFSILYWGEKNQTIEAETMKFSTPADNVDLPRCPFYMLWGQSLSSSQSFKSHLKFEKKSIMFNLIDNLFIAHSSYRVNMGFAAVMVKI